VTDDLMARVWRTEGQEKGLAFACSGAIPILEKPIGAMLLSASTCTTIFLMN